MYYVDFPNIGVALDISRMDFADDFSRQWHPKFKTHFCRTRMAEKISNVGLGRWPNNIKQHAYMQHIRYVFNKGFVLFVEALKDRNSPTLGETPFSIGMLIALFERAVGFYASLISVNTYHQPGVETSKIAAEKVIELLSRVLRFLTEKRGSSMGCAEAADELGSKDAAESVFQICEHPSSNVDHWIRESRRNGSNLDSIYIME